MTKGIESKAGEVSGPLLVASDPAPFETINEAGSARCLIMCEHAGTAIPKKLNLLGLSDEDVSKHYAVDIGARQVSTKLSELLDAPAIMGNYSRLVVDVNRRLDHQTVFVEHGDEQDISGNIGISDAEKQLRIDEVYDPYHSETARLIGNFLRNDIVPVVISVHSFEKVFYKLHRLWDVGVLWIQDRRLSMPVIKALEKRELHVGDNEPYDARMARGTAIDKHADEHGFPNVTFEVRNDLIDTDAGATVMAQTIADCLQEVLEDGEIFSKYEGSQAEYDSEMEKHYFRDLIKRAKEGE